MAILVDDLLRTSADENEMPVIHVSLFSTKLYIVLRKQPYHGTLERVKIRRYILELFARL